MPSVRAIVSSFAPSTSMRRTARLTGTSSSPASCRRVQLCRGDPGQAERAGQRRDDRVIDDLTQHRFSIGIGGAQAGTLAIDHQELHRPDPRWQHAYLRALPGAFLPGLDRGTDVGSLQPQQHPHVEVPRGLRRDGADAARLGGTQAMPGPDQGAGRRIDQRLQVRSSSNWPRAAIWTLNGSAMAGSAAGLGRAVVSSSAS